jgi:hypothetical protein
LARPRSEIHKLASKIQDIIYLPNPDPLYVVLGSVVGNLLKGDPVWIVLIGPPSCGKSTLLGTVHYDRHHKVPKTLEVDSIKSAGAMLSGTSRKDISKQATGGMLRRIGDHGILIVKDFTTTMSAAREPLLEVLGALRKVYDGAWTREVGTDGGRFMDWYGKMGLLTACTGAIDRHHAIIGDLGQRWMYYRMEESDGFGKSKSAMNNLDPKERGQILSDLVNGFFENLELDWSDEGMSKRELTDLESNRIFSLASFGAAARSSVERDWRTKEVKGTPETEESGRLSSGLSQLYLGLEVIGLEILERWRIVSKIALDSMPKIRLEIVKRVLYGAATPNELRTAAKVSAGTVRCAAEDLELHGILEGVMKGDGKGDKTGSWRLSKWGRSMLRQGGVV